MIDRMTFDPAICHGKPCMRGLRYPVENVLEWLASGMSIEDILAVLAFAAPLYNRNHAGSTDRHPDELRRSDLVQ